VLNHEGSRAALSTNQGAPSISPVRGTRSASGVVLSTSRSFEPRIIRSSAGDGDSEYPPNPSTSHTQTRRASMASVRTTAPQRPVIPQHVIARTAPVSFPRPSYLDHSSLRNMLHTELPTHPIPSRRADPTISSRNQAYANALSTPSETDDDSPGSSFSHSTLALRDHSFKLPTRWSDLDRHPSLSVSAEGRELVLHGQSLALSDYCHAE
jgi:hypothetical protein